MEISSLLGFGTKCSEIKVLQKVEKKKKERKKLSPIGMNLLKFCCLIPKILRIHHRSVSSETQYI